MDRMIRRKQKRLADAQYQQEKRSILDMLARLDQFTDLSPEAQAARYALCKEDFWEFCRFYLRHYFTTETQADFHGEIVDLLEREEIIVAIAAPRGFSKSTIISFAFPLWCILFEQKRFGVIMMENVEKATMQTWRILLELQYNHRIIADFGKIVSDEAARADFTTLQLSNRKFETRLLAFGTGMNMRGLINAQHRPDLFIGDDLETRELARNEKRVAKLLELILNDYFFAMCAEGYSFIINGTIICRGSTLDELRKKYIRLFEERGVEPPEMIFRLFRAIENMGMPEARSTWPELHPLQKLLHQKEIVGTAAFMAEKQNDPQDNEGAFKEKNFKHWAQLPPDFDMNDLVMQVDPSFSDVGDNKAMVIGNLYKHTKENPYYGQVMDSYGKPMPEGEHQIAVDMFNRKCSIDEMIRTMYKWHGLYHPTEINFDGTYAQKVIFKREFARFEAMPGFYKLPIKYIQLDRSKDERILELQPLVEQEGLWLPPRSSKDVDTTVIQFVRYKEPGMNDDGPDVNAAWIERCGKRKRKARVTLL